MKKYVVLALLPIAFGNALICKDKYADLDAILMSEFRAAQKTMNSSTKLELEAILHALVSFAKKAKINRQVAIDKILAIKAALQVCKSEQYKTSWDTVCSYFSVNPEIVTKQIDPALAKVNKALDDLKVTSSEYRFAVSALKVLGVGAVLLAVAGGAAVLYNKYINGVMDSAAQENADADTFEAIARRNEEVGSPKNSSVDSLESGFISSRRSSLGADSADSSTTAQLSSVGSEDDESSDDNFEVRVGGAGNAWRPLIFTDSETMAEVGSPRNSSVDSLKSGFSPSRRISISSLGADSVGSSGSGAEKYIITMGGEPFQLKAPDKDAAGKIVIPVPSPKVATAIAPVGHHYPLLPPSPIEGDEDTGFSSVNSVNSFTGQQAVSAIQRGDVKVPSIYDMYVGPLEESVQFDPDQVAADAARMDELD